VSERLYWVFAFEELKNISNLCHIYVTLISLH